MLSVPCSRRFNATHLKMRVSVCKSWSTGNVLLGRLVALLAISLLSLQAADKQILLRNEVITTAPPQRQALRPQSAEEPVSGLFLLQLEDDLPTEWRDQLSALGVKLLR